MNLPAIQNQSIDYSNAKMLETIKNTVAVGATDAELEMFIALCRSTGLNPFKKEIWFIKVKGYQRKNGSWADDRVQVMTGINGFFQIANRHPQFDGMEEPEFQEDANGRPIKCTVRVHRKDRKIEFAAAEAKRAIAAGEDLWFAQIVEKKNIQIG